MNNFKIIKKNNGTCDSYNSKTRFYINSKDNFRKAYIFDLFDIYFSGDISNSIKNATEKGIRNLINATGLYSNKINYFNLSKEETENFFYKLGISKFDKDVATNFLSGYGYKKKAYQIMVGNFDLNELNGFAVGEAAIINNYNNAMIHEFLISHELGHIFNAVKSDRKNIVNALGLHCNDVQKNKITPCVMRQDISQEHLETLSKVGAIYCPDCVKGMKEYIQGNN